MKKENPDALREGSSGTERGIIHEEIWIPTTCDMQCNVIPCLLRVHRVNGVAIGVEPNTEGPRANVIAVDP